MGADVLVIDGAVSSAELLRSARGVLLDLSECAALRAAATAWSDRVDIVTGRVQGLPSDRPLAGMTAVLVRPDGRVAGAAMDATDPAEALHRVVRRPGLAVERRAPY